MAFVLAGVYEGCVYDGVGIVDCGHNDETLLPRELARMARRCVFDEDLALFEGEDCFLDGLQMTRYGRKMYVGSTAPMIPEPDGSNWVVRGVKSWLHYYVHAFESQQRWYYHFYEFGFVLPRYPLTVLAGLQVFKSHRWHKINHTSGTFWRRAGIVSALAAALAAGSWGARNGWV